MDKERTSILINMTFLHSGINHLSAMGNFIANYLIIGSLLLAEADKNISFSGFERTKSG